MRIVRFPYVQYRGEAAPVVWFRVKRGRQWHTAWAYVDSGATFTVLSAKEAERLGVPYKKGKLVMVTVGDGGAIPVYIHRLQVAIGSNTFHTDIGFSPRLGVGFNLLGRRGIFDRFDVIFSDSKRIVTFRPTR